MIQTSVNWVDELFAYCEESNLYGSLANVSAIINEHTPGINWVGFYINRSERLYLGPFQGKAACTQIKWGDGVCGTAAKENKLYNVPDVELFPTHIACDSDSKSELVIPIVQHDQVKAVLDIDSPNSNHFTAEHEQCFQRVVRVLEKHLVF